MLLGLFVKQMNLHIYAQIYVTYLSYHYNKYLKFINKLRLKDYLLLLSDVEHTKSVILAGGRGG